MWHLTGSQVFHTMKMKHKEPSPMLRIDAKNGEKIMKLNIIYLGKIEYLEALEIQKKIMKLKQERKIDNTLLLLEHPPVITLGRRAVHSNIIADNEKLRRNNIILHEIERGGDVTYHGPGQLVGYPIIDLKDINKGVKNFVWTIEELFIKLLNNEFAISACRDEKNLAGIWVGDEKITAIGIAVKHWVTMHGFAFNINTELQHFKFINPCGITDKGVISMEKLLGCPQDFEKISKMVADYFCELFNFEPQAINLKDLDDILN